MKNKLFTILAIAFLVLPIAVQAYTTTSYPDKICAAPTLLGADGSQASINECIAWCAGLTASCCNIYQDVYDAGGTYYTCEAYSGTPTTYVQPSYYENEFGFGWGTWHYYTAVLITGYAPAGIDFTAGTPSVATGTLTPSAAITFTANVSNGGTINATSTFSNYFQIDLGNNGTYDTTLVATSSTVGLNAAQVKSVTSPAWTASLGTHKVRMCADLPSSLVTETNESNNCGTDYTFTIAAPVPPTASLASSPAGITTGQSATLTWSTSNATSCTGTNFSTSGSLNGSLVVSPATTTTYSIACTGPAGSASATTTTTVTAGPNVTTYPNKTCSGGTLVGSNSFTSNSCVTYCTSYSASCCTIRSFTQEFDSSYTCSAYTGTQALVTNNGTNSCSGGVEPICTSTHYDAALINYGPAVSASLSVSPASISSGQQSVISWTSGNASTCTGTNFSTGGAIQGSVTITPTTTKTYTVLCSGAGGSASDTKNITVNYFTVSCAPSPSPVTVGQSLSWNAAASGGTGSYTYSWSGTDGLSGAGSSIAKVYTTLGEKMATLAVTSGTTTITTACTGAPCQTSSCTCSSAGCGVIVQEGVSSDLSASAPAIISGTAVPGGSLSFGAGLLNIGNNSISAIFQNRFQVDIGSDGVYEVNLDSSASAGAPQMTLEYGKTCSSGAIVATDGAQLYGSGSLESTIENLCAANSTPGQCCAAVVTTGSSGGGGGGGGGGGANLVSRLANFASAAVYKQLAMTYYDVAVTVYSNPTKVTCAPGQSCYAGVWTSLSGTQYSIPYGGTIGVTSPTWSNIPGGLHNVRMCADSPSSQLSESNEGNNCGPATSFAVSGFDLSAGTTTLNTGTLVAGNALTFVGPVLNNPATYVPSGQCQTNVVVSSSGACSIAVNGDQLTWSTTGATMVTNIDPLTSSPTIPQTGSNNMIVTSPTEAGFFTSQALKADMLAHGGVNFSETSFVNRTGNADQVTLDRACKMITGNAAATAKAWGARGWSSCGNNGNLKFDGTNWTSASGCIGAHLFSQLDCQYPGSPYALSGTYFFTVPLSVGTHTYQLTSNAPSNNTCQATITIPAGGEMCTMAASPSIVSSGGSTNLSWETSNGATFFINNGVGTSTPAAAGSRSVTPSVSTTYTGTVTAATSTFAFNGCAPSSFEIDLSNDGSWDTSLPVSGCLTSLGVTQTVNVISPSWTSTLGTHRARLCANSPASTTETNTVNNCGAPYTFTVTAPPAPTATIVASSTSLALGSSSNFIWSSTNATACVGTNFSTANAANGSSSVTPTTTTSYSVRCTGAGGSASATTTISINAADLVAVTPVLNSGSLSSGSLVTFRASTTNSGAANTTTTFSNRFQIDIGNNGSYDTNLDATSSVSGLNISQTKGVISPSWSATTGTHKIRFCADAPTSAVPESDESNNCSTDYTFTVSAPPPTSSLSASPTTVVTGNSSTLTWGSTNATSCTGTGFSTGGLVSGSAAVSPSATTTYTVACAGTGGTATTTATVGISSGTFDLTSGVPSVYSGSLVATTSVRFQGFVTNGGTGSSSVTFNNRFQIDLGNNGSWNTNLNATSSIVGIASGQSKTALSPTWTAIAGTHAVRLCADTPTSALSETNESNNCGSSYVFTVGSAPNAPFISGPTTGYTNTPYVFSFAATDPASTTVRYGVDWDNNSVVDQYLPASGYVSSGVYQDATRSWSATGSTTLRALTQNSNGATSTWTTHTIYISTAPPPVPIALVTISPSSFVGGQSATITWSSSDATSCTGTGFSTGNATSGSISTGPIYTTTTYSISCTGVSGTDTDSATLTITSSVDLTAGTPGLNSGSLYDGASVTFFANVNNEGNGSTTSTFGNRFQVDLNDNGSWDVNLDAANSTNGMLAGQSKSVTSPVWTASTGTHKVRMCADSPSSVVGEVDEANNCSTGYFTFTVSSTPECADGIDNNGNTFIDYPADAACTGLSDGSEEVLSTADLSVTAFPSGGSLGTPNVVKPGAQAVITWSAQNVVPDSCTLSGDNGDVWSNLTGSSGTRTSSQLTGETTFTLTCTNLNSQTVSVSATVRQTPRFQEL